jgi:hypothetical protein
LTTSVIDINPKDVIFNGLNIVIVMCEGISDKPSWLYGFANTFEVINIGKNFKPS